MAGARKKEPPSLGSALPFSSWSCLCPCGIHCFLLGASDGSWKASPTSPLTVTVGTKESQSSPSKGEEATCQGLIPTQRPGPTSYLHQVHFLACPSFSSSFSFSPVSGPFPLSREWVSPQPSPSLSPNAGPPSISCPVPMPTMFLLEDLSLATAHLLQPLTFDFYSKAAPTSPPTPKARICSRIQFSL